MKFLCVKSVVMSDKSVAFHAGLVYHFKMDCEGKIKRFTDNCLHIFYAAGDGPNAWDNWFELLEDEE